MTKGSIRGYPVLYLASFLMAYRAFF